MSPSNAPSMQAMATMGRLFQESDSDSVAMLILEGDQPLGEDAHDYYDGLIEKLRADSKHIQHIQDFWGDPLTESGAQSNDGKAAYVQLNLAGNLGETLSIESVEVGPRHCRRVASATRREGLRDRSGSASGRYDPRR